MSRELNGQTVPNGIYQSRSHGHKFLPARDIYIQDGSVQLVHDEEKHLFGYDFFFRVNTLGQKIADIPEGFNIRAIKPKETA
jgi:hypothetical protein